MPLYQKQCDCGRLFNTTRRGVIACHECRDQGRRPHAIETRKLRERNAKGNHTEGQWFERIAFQNSICFWCFRSLLDSSKLFNGTKDHLIPLARGGTNFIENIVASCWPCNRLKGKRTATEFRAYLQERGSQFSTLSTLPALIEPSGLPLELRERFFTLSRAKRMEPQSVTGLMRTESSSLPFLGMDVTRRKA